MVVAIIHRYSYSNEFQVREHTNSVNISSVLLHICACSFFFVWIIYGECLHVSAIKLIDSNNKIYTYMPTDANGKLDKRKVCVA